MLVGAITGHVREDGFVVADGPLDSSAWSQLADAYDAVIGEAEAGDRKIGSTTTRVTDFVNRSEIFDALYVHEPVLAACRSVIGRDFKLSSLHARTLHPNAAAQVLHVDFARGAHHSAAGIWPMVGFIYMVDDFREQNGATRFLPGSHLWPDAPTEEELRDRAQVPACGPRGSVIIYNGSAWHGHGRNHTSTPRRSIQGAFIHRDEQAGTDWTARMRPETLARLSPLARNLLAL